MLLTLLKLNGLQLLLISLLDLLYLLELDGMRLLQLLETQHLQLPTETKVQDQVVGHTLLFMLVDQVLTNWYSHLQLLLTMLQQMQMTY